MKLQNKSQRVSDFFHNDFFPLKSIISLTFQAKLEGCQFLIKTLQIEKATG